PAFCSTSGFCSARSAPYSAAKAFRPKATPPCRNSWEKTVPRNLIIAGAGGLGSEAAWTAEASGEWTLLGFVDDNEQRATLGTPRQAATGYANDHDIWYFCAIGNNAARARMAQTLDAFGWHAATLIHPTALVAPSARIASGAYLAAGAIIAPNVAIG